MVLDRVQGLLSRGRYVIDPVAECFELLFQMQSRNGFILDNENLT